MRVCGIGYQGMGKEEVQTGEKIFGN